VVSYSWLRPLATRHASREASGVPRRIKVERRRQIRKIARRFGGFRTWDLEAVGCLLPWEEGEEVRIFLRV